MRSFAEERFDLPEGAFPFDSHFMDIGQARLHYIREGEGPILFFLHGNPTWSFLYRNIIGALRESYDCIALDLPGFGLSKPPVHYGFTPEEHAALVAAFLNRADIRNACLIAHDWGGPIGLWAMLNTDNRLTALCLGNSWAWPVNSIFHFEWFARLMGSPIGRWTNERHAVFVNRVIPASMKRGAPDAVTLRAYRTPFDPPAARRIFFRAIFCNRNTDSRRSSGALRVFQGRLPSFGPRTISPSGGKSWRDGKSSCLGHRSPRSKTAAITCGKTLVRKASPRSQFTSKDYALSPEYQALIPW